MASNSNYYYYDDDEYNDPVDDLEGYFSRLNIATSQSNNNNNTKRKVRKHRRRASKRQPLPEEIRYLPEPKQIVTLPRLVKMETLVDTSYINYFRCGENVAMYFTLSTHNIEYGMIKNMMPPSIVVTSIDKMINPYLKMAFQLKRQCMYNNMVPELLFHGTKQKYVDSICTYNFNWRFSGAERGHRYGKGVNFSPKPIYASYFCDKARDKVMILAEVLVSKVALGKENLLVPPKGFDTTKRENGAVLVKYYDSEFCPLYVIYFTKRK